MAIEYWVTCSLDPWTPLEGDEAFGDIVDALRSDGEYEYDDGVELSLQEAGPSFVPIGSVVVHVVGPTTSNWDEVLEFLDAVAAAGDGVVFSEDRQIVLDRRSTRPGVKAFKEEPAWAKAIAAKQPGLHVVVEGGQPIADPSNELARVGLAALATRVTCRTQDGILTITGARETDVLVGGQALALAARGTAFAVGTDGTREALPR
jgi:hypothetical protein